MGQASGSVSTNAEDSVRPGHPCRVTPMGQKWYIQFHDRTEGPLTARQLQKLAIAGELTPDHLVSLDNARWFRAIKVLGLFPEGPRREQRESDVSTPIPGEDDEHTLVLDREEVVSRGMRVGPLPVEGAAPKAARGRERDPDRTVVDSSSGSEDPSAEAVTRVATQPGKTEDGFQRSPDRTKRA